MTTCQNGQRCVPRGLKIQKFMVHTVAILRHPAIQGPIRPVLVCFASVTPTESWSGCAETFASCTTPPSVQGDSLVETRREQGERYFGLQSKLHRQTIRNLRWSKAEKFLKIHVSTLMRVIIEADIERITRESRPVSVFENTETNA